MCFYFEEPKTYNYINYKNYNINNERDNIKIAVVLELHKNYIELQNSPLFYLKTTKLQM